MVQSYSKIKENDPSHTVVPLYVSVVMGFIKTVTFLYEMISWPVYSLLSTDEPVVDDQGPTLAYPVIKNKFDGSWRCVEALYDERLSQSMFPSCTTLDDLWTRSVRLWPEEKIFGSRELLSMSYDVQSNGRKFKKLTQGGYRWFTFRQLEGRIENITHGLLNYLHLRPQKDRVLIFAETRPEWMLIAQSCFRAGIPLVTLYATLGDDSIVHGVQGLR
jgi:long-chain acyl-CoA synthetase